MKIRNIILGALWGFIMLGGPQIHAQDNWPFINDIRNFHRQDSLQFPAGGANLFVGSSSFTMWNNIHDFFPGKKLLNRAFGGSTLEDLIRYRYDVIFPYDPAQIIMYCGENDFAASDTVQVQTVVNRFISLFEMIRLKYPQIPFAYVSMKPSPSREKLMPKFDAANILIRDYLARQSRATYVDAYSAMLQPNGKPLMNIWLDDKLHMNINGYIIWQGLLRRILL